MNSKINAIFVAIFLIIALEVVKAQSQNVHDSCNAKMSCRECVLTQNCAWCLQTSYDNLPRCFTPKLSVHKCTDIWNPRNEGNITSKLPLTQDKSSSTNPSSKHIVQISPQSVSLKLRINELYKMNFDYSRAEDYPVDLYYLMDLSGSMKDDKEKLSKLGLTLAEAMKKITKNFRLGFGSFVDKVLMPFTSTVPSKLVKPCPDCVAPFGFRNNMPLSNDTDKFAKEVDAASVSGNLDSPEGGFDAIMQAVVCQEQIGWRSQARRLLLFTTDAPYHHAGDGKLAGIITPNDGLCHLENDLYSLSSEQDYPSISQINLKVKEHSVNVIFAVTAAEENIYKVLSKNIEGSTSSVLSDDSSNIVELVQDQYNKISSSVEMKDNAPSFIKVKYYSKCLGNKIIPTNKCDGLKVGNVVTFETEILVTSCPSNPKEWVQSFRIYSVGINESLTVNLELMCSCPCEKAGEINSPVCKGYGTLKCGICECNKLHYGRSCECSIDDPDKNQHQCRPDNITQVDCSGRGNCVCGQCECTIRENINEVVSGKFCECDNYSCDRENGFLCSGPEQGICDCGTCKCQKDWTGSACQCPNTEDICIAPNDEEICSGHGSCNCGKCECETIDGVRYTGKYCEKCEKCTGRCSELKNCVLCQMFKKGPHKDPKICAEKCLQFDTIPVDSLNPTEEEHLCSFYDDDDGCRYHFVYNETKTSYKTVTLAVRALKKLDCEPEISVLIIVLGVVGTILLIGLGMLLLWKLLTTVHDRREFTRFEKEKLLAKWDQGDNPLYKEATSTFKNPTFGG